jgi:peptide/nickel transport system permease protein
VIEYIFAWPGMGQLGVSSVFARDYPVLMAILVFSSLLIMLGTLISDIVYQWADPRVGQTSV